MLRLALIFFSLVFLSPWMKAQWAGVQTDVFYLFNGPCFVENDADFCWDPDEVRIVEGPIFLSQRGTYVGVLIKLFDPERVVANVQFKPPRLSGRIDLVPYLKKIEFERNKNFVVIFAVFNLIPQDFYQKIPPQQDEFLGSFNLLVLSQDGNQLTEVEFEKNIKLP